jgi:acyl-CoA thioester hydrolase
MPREHFRFFHSLRVRWAEVDRQGIVFNGHYLTYFDVAITEYWRAIGYPYPDGLLRHGCDTFVKKATLEYHAPAEFDDLLDIAVRVARIGRSSMRFLLEIHRAGDRLIEGELIYVLADPASRKPTRVPDFLRAAIRTYEAVAPEDASG